MYRLEIASLIIIIFLALLFFMVRKNRSKLHILYGLLLFASFANVLLDTATLYMVNHMDTVPERLNSITHRFFIVSFCLLFYIIYTYLTSLFDSEVGEKVRRVPFSWFPLLVSVVAIAILPLHFNSDGDVHYSYGPATYVIYACVSVYIFMSIASLLKYGSSLNLKKRMATSIALLCEAIVCLYEALVPSSLLSSLGVVLVVMGFYLTTENPDAILIEKLEREKERAEAAEQEALAADKAKGRFLTHMSHEIRTPINAILGMDEMIIRETRELSIKDYAFDIRSAGNTLLAIVNDVLDYTKIQTDKMELELIDYDVVDIAYDIHNIISPRAHAKNIAFNVKVDPNLPRKLWGDDIRLKQVILHLLTNAIKFTHEGSVGCNVKVISKDDRFARIHIEVTDTGIGIKPEDREKLFEEFHRIEEKRNLQIEGTGLGLNVTVGLLSLMGSKLNVESEYGVGSTFSFEFTQQIIDDTPVGDSVDKLSSSLREVERDYSLSFIAPDAKVLIVDDEEMNRRVFKSLVGLTKIRVFEAPSGETGVEMATKEHFDLIFMDHMMPGIDGVEALDLIRQTPRSRSADTPIIMLTANAVSGARKHFLSKGFDDFIAKPIDPTLLKNMLQAYLPPYLMKQSHLSDDEQFNETDDLTASELPIVNGLDWSYARLHFANDKLMFNIIDFFCSVIETDAFELESYFADVENDFNRRHYQTKVHSMKSSAATVGVIPLAGMAKVLEDSAKSSDFETLRILHPVFIRKWYEYSEILSQFMRQSKPAKSAYEEKDAVNALLKKLHDAADDMDIDLLDKAMSELKSYSFEGEDEDRIDGLQAAVRNFDVDYITENSNFTI